MIKNLRKYLVVEQKVEQEQSKIEGQEVKDELDDKDNTKTFDFVIERKNRLGREENNNGESKESVREENQKETKRSCGFSRAEEENQTETSRCSNKRWNSNSQNVKETDPQYYKELTSSTGPIKNYHEGYNISAKEHKINSSERIDTSVIIYHKITTEVDMDKQ